MSELGSWFSWGDVGGHLSIEFDVCRGQMLPDMCLFMPQVRKSHTLQQCGPVIAAALGVRPGSIRYGVWCLFGCRFLVQTICRLHSWLDALLATCCSASATLFPNNFRWVGWRRGYLCRTSKLTDGAGARPSDLCFDVDGSAAVLSPWAEYVMGQLLRMAPCALCARCPRLHVLVPAWIPVAGVRSGRWNSTRGRTTCC